MLSRLLLATTLLVSGCVNEKEKTVEEFTFSIIKPDAVAHGDVENINKIFTDNGLKIVAQKRTRLTIEQAEKFYAVHKERPFFKSLCKYMTSGEVVLQVLYGPNAVSKNRELMGATDPKEAADGTIRKLYGTDKGCNAVHGSDSAENAKKEIAIFFEPAEINR